MIFSYSGQIFLFCNDCGEIIDKFSLLFYNHCQFASDPQ